MPVEEVLRLRGEIEAIKSALGEALTVGVVHEVDAKRGYRINLGEGTEGPMLSPWLPHPESGGQTASWVPLSEGQIVGLFSPSGDLRQGLLLRGGFGGENSPPSQDMAANVLEAFGIRMQMKDGQLLIQCRDATIECATAKVEAADRVDVDTETALIKAEKIDLGDEGGPRVARIGDLVHVKVGSSAGFWPIVTGSSTTHSI